MHVLVVTGGHPFEREPFLEMVGAVVAGAGATWEHVEHPAATDRLAAAARDGDVDAVVFYDMPGLRFTRTTSLDPTVPAVELVPPPSEHVAALERMTERGTGLVLLHHALAAWPAWPEYAELAGGRFHYAPGVLRGTAYPDSGYLLDVTHTVEVVAPDHPVCAGLPPAFELHDELYCCPVFASDVVPLLRTTHPSTADRFWSADRAIRGRRDDRTGWDHPAGSPLVGWAHERAASRVVYLQPGDGPASYASAELRRLLANALAWVARADPPDPGGRGPG